MRNLRSGLLPSAPYREPQNYQVKLLTNGALLFGDLADLVSIDDGYNHYRRFRAVE